METTETPEQPLPEQPKPGLILGEVAKYYLHTIGRWANFFSILGYISTGFIILIVLFVGVIFSTITAAQEQFAGPQAGMVSSMMSASLTVMRFIFIAFAVYSFFVAFYLGKFAARIKKATALNDTLTATNAFENLKSYFKLIGITTIVLLALDILVFIIMLIVGIGAASMRR
ncbi:DUF5362 family protein [Mucilaginibacter sp. L196]|uniref:DUF5362 family protein n=1 Tax=Mucilaginibacter sp. L196 TaxID=1641870 RepID=UPI00131DDB7D|nr:DUF5362 family protein [Mucilaginibacter sp. L196]